MPGGSGYFSLGSNSASLAWRLRVVPVGVGEAAASINWGGSCFWCLYSKSPTVSGLCYGLDSGPWFWKLPSLASRVGAI